MCACSYACCSECACLCALSWVVRWWSCLRRASSNLLIWSGRRRAELGCSKTYCATMHVRMKYTVALCSDFLLWSLFTKCVSRSGTTLLDWIFYEWVGLPEQWCWSVSGPQGKCEYLWHCSVNVIQNVCVCVYNHRNPLSLKHLYVFLLQKRPDPIRVLSSLQRLFRSLCE